jgi:predicted component of type VI protein secretion system
VAELSFEVVEGPDAGRVVALEGSLVVGGAPPADVVLADRRVEAQHTRVTVAGDGLLVEDLGESGGTFVNDAELRAPTRMGPGDELQVGVTVLKLRAGADAASAVRAKPPALASSQSEPAFVAAAAAELRRSRNASEVEELLDVRTKRMARHAPLAVFVIVVYAVLIYLATARL